MQLPWQTLCPSGQDKDDTGGVSPNLALARHFLRFCFFLIFLQFLAVASSAQAPSRPSDPRSRPVRARRREPAELKLRAMASKRISSMDILTVRESQRWRLSACFKTLPVRSQFPAGTPSDTRHAADL